MQRVLDWGCDLGDLVGHLDRAGRLPCFSYLVDGFKLFTVVWYRYVDEFE